VLFVTIQAYSSRALGYSFVQQRPFSVIVKGDNGEYLVTYDHGQWSCNSEYFARHGYDSHTMAVEKLLDEMLHQPERI
jgi:hypothetical protein